MKANFSYLKFYKMEERTRSNMVTGMFNDRQSVEDAYNNLHESGYSKDDINLVMSDETKKRLFTKGESEIGNKALEGAGTGSAIGVAVGAAAGAIAAIGSSIIIPGLGLVIAGPLAAALAGAGAGSVAGGLIGALIGAGIPEERARLYESGVKDGKIVMGVKVRNEEDAKKFESDWKARKAENVYR
jgi:hypothetical protein